MNIDFKVISLIPCIVSITLLTVLIGTIIKINYINIYEEHYLAFLILYGTNVILNIILFKGKINIVLNDDYLVFKWMKKPLYSSIKNQKIHLSEITKAKHYSGKAAEQLFIKLKTEKKIRLNISTRHSNEVNHLIKRVQLKNNIKKN